MRLPAMRIHKLTKNCRSYKDPCGVSADHDVANKPYRIHVCDYCS